MTTACKTCGGVFVRRDDAFTTCMGFLSPPGHDHDNNHVHASFWCAAGHRTVIGKRRRCPAAGCDWVSREEGGGIVNQFEWPDVVPPAAELH